jgi:hypothetical protein
MKALIVFHDDEPPASSSEGSRSARHAARKSTNEKRRSEVIDQLKEAGLAGQVALSPASPLSSLLIDGSEEALEIAKQSPSVRDVLRMSDDDGLELIQ